MTLEELRAALAHPRAPAGLPPLLHALWLDARGDWDGAHAVAQDDPSAEAAWVHAYLHRKEGDQGNAGYWYGRAGRARFSGSLDEEWEAIARVLLES
jgi:hypothetical protein